MTHIKDILEDIRNFEDNHVINGSIALSCKGHIIYAKAFGIADFDANTSCMIDTQYNIGSVTKQFTAAALLRALYDLNPSFNAIQEALQTPLAKYLLPDDFIWNAKMPEWANTVTLHQLLTHTSGIVNYTDLDAFWDQLYSLETPLMIQLIDLFKELPLRFQPGTQYEYSNSGYSLLGQVIERLSQKTLSQYLKETFFIPLGMTNTALPIKGKSLTLRKTEAFSHLARGYTYDIEKFTKPYTEVNHYWPHSIDAGDGGMISTVLDLIKWNEAFYKGQVLSGDLSTLMLTPHEAIPEESEAFYCYGLVWRRSPIGTIYTHGGSIPGYRSYPIYIPALEMTIVSLSNLSFDNSCIQDKKQALRDELAHIEESQEKEELYYQTFSQRYPEIVKLQEKHALLGIKDLRILQANF